MSDRPAASCIFDSRFNRTALVVALVGIGAFLRLVSLRTSPAWYHDECIYVQQVANLMRGVFAWDGVAHTYLPRLPLMHALIMPFFAVFGKDILWVRLVSALAGITTIWLVYRIGREIGGRREAVLGAGLFAIFSYVVLINRWGFSYNIDMVLGAANLFFAQRVARDPSRRRDWWLVAATAGLGLLVDPIMLSRFVLLAALVVLLRRTWRAAALVAASAVPLGIYVALMLALRRELFLEDVRVILGQRVMDASIPYLLDAFWQYLSSYEPLLLLGVVGLFLLPANRAARVLLWAFLLDLAFVLKSSGPDASVLFRVGIVLAPMLMVGAGWTADRGWRRGWAIAAAKMPFFKRLPSAPVLGLLVRSAVAIMLGLWLLIPAVEGAMGLFRFDYNDACIFSIEDAEALAQWANERLAPDDLVISTHINWMLNCRTTSPMIADLVERGQQSPIYFEELARRTMYPCDFDSARWMIVHEAYPGLIKHYHFDERYLEIIDTWQMIHSEGLFRVYANPAHPASAAQ